MSGTYLLVLLGPASVIVASLIPSLTALESLAFIALAFGCTVACVIKLLGNFSGAHSARARVNGVGVVSQRFVEA